MKGTYAAVFTPKNGRYYVRVPDMPGCVTSGDSYEDAFDMVLDAANLWMTDLVERKEKIPKATPMEQIKREDGDMLMLIQIDTDEYLRKTESRAVRRSVSIPAWMDMEVQERGLSLSRVLQDALKSQLA
ncbi:MAG: type II toxin-antitoxin system HicB family antitoxin [Clostridia bacterium]|nr:type II toxin-antitoxin system HicB family antitoxin [Clostridia bacterium]